MDGGEFGIFSRLVMDLIVITFIVDAESNTSVGVIPSAVFSSS